MMIFSRASGVKLGHDVEADKTPSALGLDGNVKLMLGLRTPFVAPGRSEHRCSVCGACPHSAPAGQTSEDVNQAAARIVGNPWKANCRIIFAVTYRFLVEDGRPE